MKHILKYSSFYCIWRRTILPSLVLLDFVLNKKEVDRKSKETVHCFKNIFSNLLASLLYFFLSYPHGFDYKLSAQTVAYAIFLVVLFRD